MPLRTDFSRMNCSLARALEELGDPWTLLVLRECLLGVERFEDFASALGVARKTLSSRLAAMVGCGLLQRESVSAQGKVASYRLTEKAWAVVPALVGLMQWGDEWLSGREREPMVALAGGARLAPLALRTAGGRRVEPASLQWRAGPGADRRTRHHLESRLGSAERPQAASAGKPG